MLLQRQAGVGRQAAAGGEVGAARKAASLAGQQQAARAGAGQALHRRAQLVDHRAVERVEPVRPVERDRRDRRRALLQPDMLEFHRPGSVTPGFVPQLCFASVLDLKFAYDRITPGANFKSNKHTSFIGWLVWLKIRKFAPAQPCGQANFRIATLVKQAILAAGRAPGPNGPQRQGEGTCGLLPWAASLLRC